LKRVVAQEAPEYPDVHVAAHDVLRAIEHMHRAGVVHCDIRPKNVLMKQREGCGHGHEVMGRWQAVLGDFDVSLNSTARATLRITQTSTAKGPRGFYGRLTLMQP
jgi:serine/threonine protein kinase